MNTPRITASPLGLALQGGGAHGAFTWGVLDRLLEEPDLTIDAVSGTSSGALNSLALAQGWMDGGREGARECLRRLWERIGAKTQAVSWIFDAAPPGGRQVMRNLHRYFTPQQMNPLGYNPVRDIAEALFDFERLRDAAPFALHLAATRVRDGTLTMFGPERLSIEALLASTCLPQLFAPVKIDGEIYWDGGWAGNPVLEPLVYSGIAENILCVLVQPMNRPIQPQNASDIAERMNALAFSTSFLRELRTLCLAKDSIDGERANSWLGRRLGRLQTYLIEPGESLDGFHAKTRFATPPEYLTELHDYGRDCAESWIVEPAKHLVTAQSLRLHAETS